MINVIQLSDSKPSAIMLNAILLSVAMLKDVKLSVIMPNVVAPFKTHTSVVETVIMSPPCINSKISLFLTDRCRGFCPDERSTNDTLPVLQTTLFHW
jgi:hypothetical protein